MMKALAKKAVRGFVSGYYGIMTAKLFSIDLIPEEERNLPVRIIDRVLEGMDEPVGYLNKFVGGK